MRQFSISLQHISKSYGGQRVLDDVSCGVRAGTVHALLGRNGAGKSTLCSILLGLTPPDAGSVTVSRENGQPHLAQAIGASIDGPAFYGHLSARQNLLVHCRLLGLPTNEADRALAVTGLSHAGRKKAKTFSTGMQARLALAQAILGDPEILVLDEPQNGLDPDGIVQLRQLLRRWATNGGTVLVSSHQLGEVQNLADDITILSEGKVAYTGGLSSLAPAGDLEEAFFSATKGGLP
ncbi:ATP-binding cassette domain-containing protein [Corynebacterium heidelbergense]|uniref:Bacitracin ABC transporter ATP-binding protein n=1 Tax=Corynebacterium heidelbergense TaxID=2055947 RepID=A0A364VC43_9CORY|nr:ATP-binding cassette domain-containing protein [Corynebacterium heidelbergense]RAV34219.1 bacitracin ABC transporter ATP-binding protein [Corynebacterium heidelbergense]WCZ35814.1 putative ABC transporter ATP-binding protein YxlF [Corynebacterium heidelbergense]